MLSNIWPSFRKKSVLTVIFQIFRKCSILNIYYVILGEFNMSARFPVLCANNCPATTFHFACSQGFLIGLVLSLCLPIPKIPSCWSFFGVVFPFEQSSCLKVAILPLPPPGLVKEA